MGLVKHEITGRDGGERQLRRTYRNGKTVLICKGTFAYCDRVLSCIRGTSERPRLYREIYPKLGRYFWRVSPAPSPRTATTLELWDYAHRMAREMNMQEDERRHGLPSVTVQDIQAAHDKGQHAGETYNVRGKRYRDMTKLARVNAP